MPTCCMCCSSQACCGGLSCKAPCFASVSRRSVLPDANMLRVCGGDECWCSANSVWRPGLQACCDMPCGQAAWSAQCACKRCTRLRSDGVGAGVAQARLGKCDNTMNIALRPQTSGFPVHWLIIELYMNKKRSRIQNPFCHRQSFMEEPLFCHAMHLAGVVLEFSTADGLAWAEGGIPGP